MIISSKVPEFTDFYNNLISCSENAIDYVKDAFGQFPSLFLGISFSSGASGSGVSDLKEKLLKLTLHVDFFLFVWLC